MAINTKKTRILMKTDTTSNWEKAVNFTPLLGEICIYSDGIATNDFDEEGNQIFSPGIKIGDGETLIKNLPFINEIKAISLEEINKICGSSILPGEGVEF